MRERWRKVDGGVFFGDDVVRGCVWRSCLESRSLGIRKKLQNFKMRKVRSTKDIILSPSDKFAYNGIGKVQRACIYISSQRFAREDSSSFSGNNGRATTAVDNVASSEHRGNKHSHPHRRCM